MVCRHCNSEFELTAGMQFCPHCGQPIEASETQAPSSSETPVQSEAEGKDAPWEDREYSYLDGFWLTFREAVFNPVEFFRTLRPGGDIFMPLLFAIIFVFFSQLVGIIYLKIFGMPFMGFFRQLMEAQGQSFEPAMFENMVMGQAYAQLLMVPILYIIFLFIGAGINHVLLLMFKAGKNGFASTFKVMCYAYGASVFNVIPLVGGMIATIWWIILSVIGYREIHRTTTTKVILATVVIPLALCAFCCVLMAVAIMGMFSAAAGIH